MPLPEAVFEELAEALGTDIGNVAATAEKALEHQRPRSGSRLAPASWCHWELR
jgi:hypothetical protein